jgi:hypothetical protein
MDTKRTFYPKKSDWARAQIARLEATLSPYYEERIPSSNWRAVRSKSAGMDTLRRDISKYRKLAERFQAEGK